MRTVKSFRAKRGSYERVKGKSHLLYGVEFRKGDLYGKYWSY